MLLRIAALLTIFATAMAEEDLLPEIPDGKVAEVNGEVITKSEVMSAIRIKIDGLKSHATTQKELKDEVVGAFQFELCQRAIERAIALQAKRDGIEVSEQEIDVAVEREEKQFAKGDHEEFKRYIAQKKQNMSMFREEQRRKILAHNVMFRGGLMDPGACFVTPEEVRKFYMAHPEEFDLPERIQVRVLVIRAQKGEEDHSWRLAQAIRRQIDAGAEFEVIQKFRDADHAGDPAVELSWRTRKDLEDPLAEAAFAAPKGAVVGPVKGERGIYLARVEGHEPESKISFEKAQEDIHQYLVNVKYDKEIRKAQAALLKKFSFTFNVPGFQAWFDRQFDVDSR